MGERTQTSRQVAIFTPLGEDVILFRRATIIEHLGRMFQMEVDVFTEEKAINFADIVGQNVTIRLEHERDGSPRYFNGYVTRILYTGGSERVGHYRLTLCPWLWFLTRTSDCRIFQKMKAPDIIVQIFRDKGFTDFSIENLHGTYAEREYCVQYRETDFNFVSRLMEEEGIYYYFKHEDGKHVLILANDPAAHEPCPGQKTARYDFRGGAVIYEDVITEWHYQEEFRTGAWAQTDYNFETPSTSLAVTVNGKNPYEIYEYPGEYRARGEGDKLARIRLQEQTTPCVVSQGSSGCRHFNSGFQFTLEDHYRTDLNKAYLLTAVRHVATQNDYQVGAATIGGDE